MFLNIFGQRVIDKSDKIYDSTYCDTNWYLMSPKLRYLIYIIMIRSTNEIKLTAGNMIDVSSESAGKVCLTSIDIKNFLRSQNMYLDAKERYFSAKSF